MMKFLINLKRRIILSMHLDVRRTLRKYAKEYNELILNQPPQGYVDEIIETKSGVKLKYKFWRIND